VLVAYAIDKLQAANYTLVTVAECLGLAPYSFVGQLGTRDVSMFLVSATYRSSDPYRLHYRTLGSVRKMRMTTEASNMLESSQNIEHETMVHLNIH
jgi:hypothetical protein